MKKSVLFAALSAAMFSVGASASDLNYNYLQLSYAEIEVDGDLEMDGPAFEGSALISENVYVVASARKLESESFFGGRLKTHDYGLGLGYRFELSQRTDIIAQAGWTAGEVEVRYSGESLLKEDENGHRVDLGIRHLLAPQFETSLIASHSELYDFEVAAGVAYHFNSSVAVTAGYSVGDDLDTWNVGVRVKF